MSSYNWSPLAANNGIPVYSTLSAFPSASLAGNGALAIALDTDILYISTGAAWSAISGTTTVLTVGTIDTGTPSANGAQITTNSLILQSASATRPGLVNNTTQTFSGNKTFTGNILPATSFNYDLGGVSNWWNIAYIDQIESNFILDTSAIARIALSTADTILASPTGGNIVLQPHASQKIQFQDGSQGTSGRAWVSSDTSGSGAWNTLPSISGTLVAGQFPALLGDVTTSAGSLTTAVTKIAGTTVSGTTGSANVVFSTAPTMSNPVVGTQSQGNSSTLAASTAYVDTAVANAIAGVNPAVAVQAATTSAGNTSSFTYNNGASGIGATLTGPTNTALTVDGYTFTALGQRLLVKNDTQSPSGAYNGVYYVTQVQALALGLVLTRALDYDMPSDINNTGAIPVINGTVNGTTSWVITSSVTTVGTDPLTFVKFTRNPADYLLVANNLSDVANKASSFDNLSPMTTSGDVIYGGASGTGTRLGANSTATNKFLRSVSSGIPAWAQVDATDLSGTLTADHGGTGRATLTNHGVLIGAGTSAITQLAAAAAGTVLTGQGTSSDPSFSSTPTLGIAGTTGGSLALAGVTAGTLTIQPNSNTTNYTLTWPAAQGGVSTTISNNGSGTLSWVALLSNPMSAVGDLIYSSDTNGTPARLAPNTTTTLKVLTETGTGSLGQAPTWTIWTATTFTTLTSTGTRAGALFTISTSSTVAIGDTYTNNSQTFTVLKALSATSGQVLYMSGTGAPQASGTLTRASGSGTSSITFSSSITLAAYTVPTLCRVIDVVATAGGGSGGGAAQGASSSSAGAGGGSGGTAIKRYAVTAGSTIYYAVGTGGAAGSAGTVDGNTGNQTIWDTTVVVGGGVGGRGGTATNGVTTAIGTSSQGAGGSPTGGDLNLDGGVGLAGIQVAVGNYVSGTGGASYWGGGARGRGDEGAGINAVNYGAGGSGGAASSGGTNRAGGTGQNGVIDITEYY